MRSFAWYWLLLGVLMTAPFLQAVPVDDDNQIVRFAGDLQARGDYYRAITEYERFAFLHPDGESSERARLEIARCYLLGGKPEAAIVRLMLLKSSCADRETGKDAAMLLADAYLRTGVYNKAEVLLDEFARANPGDKRVGAVRLREACCNAHFGRIDWARAALQAVPSNSPERAAASAMLNELDHAPGKHPSPALAAGLSAVLPGAGQLYAGRPGDAFLSFLVNGAVIAAAAAAFHNDEPVAGGCLALLETTFYFGNVYNAANSAARRSRSSEESFARRLQVFAGTLPAGGETGKSLPAVGVRVSF